MNSDFLLGLIAGEGSFSISIKKTSRNSSGYEIRLKFGLHMRTLDEKLVKAVKGEFGDVGNIQYRNDWKRNRGDTIQYRVTSKDDCRKVVNYIENNLTEEFRSSEKYSSYLKFKDGLNYIEREDQSSPESILRLAKIRDNMNDDTRKKRDYEFFKDKFGEVTKVSDF